MIMMTLKNKRAVTLIELLIACAVVSIAMVGTVSVLAGARRTYTEGRALARMSLRANQELESWRARDLPRHMTGRFPVTDAGDSHTTGVVAIRPFPGNNDSLVEITVTLQRSTPKGNRKVIFTTLRSRGE